ncbi:MAG: Hsp70 family protein, partial [Actinobacteria bacterium]|nr:Hsp70 family protein [Actinomycetota bacterium]
MNADGLVVGIDLGTTNSVVAYVNEAGEAQTIAGDEGTRVVPSAVYFPRSGDPIVGQLARERDVIEPGRV